MAKRDGGAERAKGRAKAQQAKKMRAAANPSASFGIPGRTYDPRGTGRSMVSNPLQGNRTPVQNAGSWAGLRGMQGSAGFQPENWPKAAAVVPGPAALGRLASTYRVVRDVSDAAKQLQRRLSQDQRWYSGKDLNRQQGLNQRDRGQEILGRRESAYEDAYSPETDMNITRGLISETMRGQKGKLRVVRRHK